MATPQKPLKHPLSDLIDIPVFQTLLDSFYEMTGMPTAILDMDGEILIASGWQRICTEFHRKHPATAERCLESDTVLASQLAKGHRFNIYRCKNGLIDVATPIVIGGIQIGNLYAGQFQFGNPDRDFFIRQAETFGFENKSYMEALDFIAEKDYPGLKL